MDSTSTLLIVGAGIAGAELALATRQGGWQGPIVLFGDESHLPYHRPPLSKAYLSGEAPPDSLAARPSSAYDKAGITLRLGIPVRSIDRAAAALRLDGAAPVRYDRLALCTGGRPRPLIAEGLPAGRTPPNLHLLRTADDAAAIAAGLQHGVRLVVIGGGYVGLEVAASARRRGATVTVLEAQPRLLARVAGPEMAAFYAQVHREAGVDVRTGVSVRRIDCDAAGAVRAVVCDDGASIEADRVVVGVGMLPNVELAEQAGLEIDRGIVVDAGSVSSDPAIVAAGDCTAHDHALYGRRVRLESVPNALEQARAAAASLCGTAPAPRTVPWFWSDQYDLKLQIVGLVEGFDACVLRGLPASRSFVAFYLKQGVPIAAEAVNRPADFMVAKRLVAAACSVDAAALADPSIALKDLSTGAARRGVESAAGKP